MTRKGITDITDADIDAYVKKRRSGRITLKRAKAKPASNGTIRRELGMLVAVFNHAVEKKRLPLGGVLHISPPPAPNAKERRFTAAEEEALLAGSAVETPAKAERASKPA